MENEFMTAESYIIKKKFDIKISDLIDTNEAMKAIEMVRQEERYKAIEAFKQFVEEYSHEDEPDEISNRSDYYIEAFKNKLENNNEKKRTMKKREQ